MGVIGISADGFPESKSWAYRLCINCGYCVDVCIVGALNHRVRKRSSDSGAAMKRYEVLQKKRKGESNEK
ncbi:4Fe-4S binding protein [Clostridium aminobutyricum]|uniref:4Fe-4S binding protein n=2 Tax=Clostridium aminobutyricum TaxID=33953 RepID=A0A939IHT6_CLOAM|nr:4Fe-4S binding protein [Clostridium aminobutyricum]